MKVGNFLRNFTVILLSLWMFQSPAQALVDVPTFRFGLGMSPLSFTAGTLYPKSTPLGAQMTINPMFMWDVASVRSRIGFHFLADLGSKYGYVANSGVGMTYLFYPMGLSSIREVRDDFSEVMKSRISPYIQFQITPCKFSITQPQSEAPTKPVTQLDYFSALVIESSFGAGLDYPISQDLIAFLGFHYRFAAFTDQETSTGAVSYNGMEVLLGIMTNFY